MIHEGRNGFRLPCKTDQSRRKRSGTSCFPPLVKKEIVDEAKELGYQDAFTIEGNIAKKTVHVVKPLRKSHTAVPAPKGEMEVLSLYLEGGYEAIASDDQRFLKKLEAANIPYLTPSACIIFLYKNGTVVKPDTLDMIERLRLFISRALGRGDFLNNVYSIMRPFIVYTGVTHRLLPD